MRKRTIKKSHKSSLACRQLSFRHRLLMLAIIFVLMFFVTASISSVATSLFPHSQRNTFLFQAAVQNLSLFAAPALITAFMIATNPIAFLGLNKGIKIDWIPSVVIALFLAFPALNALISWNAHLQLPAFLSDVETTLRNWEEMAESTTSVILSANSAGAMISGVIIIGCLTGICEELFFRGALQKIFLSGGMNPHCAVWFAAFIFSAFHFQFFGFFPRMILGAFFGYLFLYSGSIWVAAIGHAINNASVVVISWMSTKWVNTINFEAIGTSSGLGWPWLPIISAILAVSFFAFKCRHVSRRIT